ncbi:putative DNA binding protein [Bacillus phage vB_BspM_Internexus]|nr:putative DNA binding protein [Bacillus phage vB_BspM_Internexus]
MNVNQIAQHIKEEVSGVTKKQAEEMFNAFVGLIYKEVNKEQETTVSIPKLGKFTVTYRESYEGHNPSTREPMTIPASRRASFKTFDTLKKHLQEPLKK